MNAEDRIEPSEFPNLPDPHAIITASAGIGLSSGAKPSHEVFLLLSAAFECRTKCVGMNQQWHYHQSEKQRSHYDKNSLHPKLQCF